WPFRGSAEYSDLNEAPESPPSPDRPAGGNDPCAVPRCSRSSAVRSRDHEPDVGRAPARERRGGGHRAGYRPGRQQAGHRGAHRSALRPPGRRPADLLATSQGRVRGLARPAHWGQALHAPACSAGAHVGAGGPVGGPAEHEPVGGSVAGASANMTTAGGSLPPAVALNRSFGSRSRYLPIASPLSPQIPPRPPPDLASCSRPIRAEAGGLGVPL